jgi:adenylate kinase
LGQLLGVTGTPGVGKKTVSSLLAARLSYSTLDLNRIAFTGPAKKPRSSEVDTKLLRAKCKGLLLSRCVVVGHLLPDVFRGRELDFVAVLRCEPSVLKRRLVSRGYDAEKVITNVEAELIGVVLDSALRSLDPLVVHEYDSTRTSPERLAKRIASDYTHHARQTRGWIDWTLRYTSSDKLRSALSLGTADPAST